MMLSWSFRMISHTGTETRPGLPRGAAVGNLGQWAKARSSNIASFVECAIMTGLEEEAPANSVPAAAVRRGGQVFFGMTGRKGHVGGESG
ncbi:hypothetical protein KY284_028662 [Solanum tuberosum]|nr:hypothetical protein KY284_028662 [Solanum tuberosum]